MGPVVEEPAMVDDKDAAEAAGAGYLGITMEVALSRWWDWAQR